MNFLEVEENFLRMKSNYIGIGTDLEEVSKFKKYNKNDNFIRKIFTDKEITYCFSKTFPPIHLTGRFAGKEAIVKAANQLGAKTINYIDIEILNNELGVPIVKVHNGELNNYQILLSISHTKNNAIAFVIIQH